MADDMDSKTKGAWLLSHSKSLDAVMGGGRLENIQYAGRAGRLYNLLRRTVRNGETPTINAEDVQRICQLNNIDRSTREAGLSRLVAEGRIDIAGNGGVAVLGATTLAVLETTANIFESSSSTNEEKAVLHLSEKVAERPIVRGDVVEYVSDTFHIQESQANNLLDVCKSIAILDQAEDKGHVILFNNNTFRDSAYAMKAFRLMQALTPSEQGRLQDLQGVMSTKGTVLDTHAATILGQELYRRIIGIGLFDRLEVSNSSESVGYLTSPDSFQKFGRPFEDDPIDDAKALLASLTYGMTRSSHSRGNITMPSALLNRLIQGYEVGGQKGVRAIGEDYKELERRQVIKVIKKSNGRYTMSLLKKDVGELALTIIQGNPAAPEALLMDGDAVSSFKGPGETRKAIRDKHTINDTHFLVDALDKIRSGG
ncbi:hypothetical protein ACXKU5_001399 [Yersinia enterocolitica]|uniref:hypothetical protein n=1 Tax=Yersinia enterocolitica TaxID=630 RepID=UPI0027ED41A1|nr:hypothetical protein [Yersinia enterocolitica]EKN4093398.1 hypothetical protein [Yersinia enterocolitica]EKN4763379.1 hypothetical protein [Yersinia enterocolitica]EKN6001257.1 hypothetical protein [Yersinia enterocolitica]EKN6040231.1 hypothetical protein [Yersinia enterocolitica]